MVIEDIDCCKDSPELEKEKEKVIWINHKSMKWKKKIITIVASPSAHQQAWINFTNILWKSYKKVMYCTLDDNFWIIEIKFTESTISESYFM